MQAEFDTQPQCGKRSPQAAGGGQCEAPPCRSARRRLRTHGRAAMAAGSAEPLQRPEFPGRGAGSVHTHDAVLPAEEDITGDRLDFEELHHRGIPLSGTEVGIFSHTVLPGRILPCLPILVDRNTEVADAGLRQIFPGSLGLLYIDDAAAAPAGPKIEVQGAAFVLRQHVGQCHLPLRTERLQHRLPQRLVREGHVPVTVELLCPGDVVQVGGIADRAPGPVDGCQQRLFVIGELLYGIIPDHQGRQVVAQLARGLADAGIHRIEILFRFGHGVAYVFVHQRRGIGGGSHQAVRKPDTVQVSRRQLRPGFLFGRSAKAVVEVEVELQPPQGDVFVGKGHPHPAAIQEIAFPLPESFQFGFVLAEVAIRHAGIGFVRECLFEQKPAGVILPSDLRQAGTDAAESRDPRVGHPLQFQRIARQQQEIAAPGHRERGIPHRHDGDRRRLVYLQFDQRNAVAVGGFGVVAEGR